MNATILMCRPTHFEVSYTINPWMQQGAAHGELALSQWRTLRTALAAHAEIVTIDPQPGLPDMVFTANAGVVVGERAMASHFMPHERRGEEPFFKRWFRERGFVMVELPEDIGFEGAGDCLQDARGPMLWTGLGPRTEPEALAYLATAFDREIVGLRLVDPRFYHLDTCFCPLSGGHVLYHPEAFHPTSRSEIERRVPASLRVPVGTEDAANFACNAVNLGTEVFLHRASPLLTAQLARAGYRAHEIHLSEFLKAGGSAKCLTLRLDSPPFATGRAGARSAA
ncbi:MAG TPA: arginine deiminase-related protein [Steroidobacteraceae bacterium]|nr:arginine deiminase-related protein [Steroidobacteraceae bacterium]